MKLNMGSLDRILRLLLTLVVVILLITGVLKGALTVILGIVAIIFFVTSVIGFCPLYVIFGLSTKKKVS
ncbi:hypothetical protein AMJ74_02765 [candidate division WOR_3 bacterium SM1_77]|jgi:hypothetical protein|uniref:Inner membrane protein YgaP-like transmembrane domain-containing protein n=1 Tax=candidate division WOR_3 bacterium SM1_77 TaxID=1703778 RepID=A0A0S8JZ17_UNCW3|nr:MAG: hypothetical protein AMJ74_02765 [candidate division WOR_3 bacterium SM1_77]